MTKKGETSNLVTRLLGQEQTIMLLRVPLYTTTTDQAFRAELGLIDIILHAPVTRSHERLRPAGSHATLDSSLRIPQANGPSCLAQYATIAPSVMLAVGEKD